MTAGNRPLHRAVIGCCTASWRLQRELRRCSVSGEVAFRVLGPLEIGDDGRQLPLGTRLRCALLALLRANELVASERPADGLRDEAAATAHRVLVGHVLAVRGPLGCNGRVETRGRAYCLHVTVEELDVCRCESQLAHGRSRTSPHASVGSPSWMRTKSLAMSSLCVSRTGSLLVLCRDCLGRGRSAHHPPPGEVLPMYARPWRRAPAL